MWPAVKRSLSGTEKEQLIALLRALFDLDEGNRIFLAARLLDSGKRQAGFKAYRRIIESRFYAQPDGFGDLDIARARLAIQEYSTASRNVQGTLDLLLTLVEMGINLSREIGIHDVDYYDELAGALSDFADLLRQNEDLYPMFAGRLRKLIASGPGVGGGMDDDLGDMLSNLAPDLETD
jgi:hypothetical protein